MRTWRALAGGLLGLAGACASAPARVDPPGELPVLRQRFEVVNAATAGPTRCALLRDAEALQAWLGELSAARVCVAWPVDGDVDLLAVLTEDSGGTEILLATEEGVDVVTLVMASAGDVVAAPPATWRLHVMVLDRRANQLAVVLREAGAGGEHTLAVFAR